MLLGVVIVVALERTTIELAEFCQFERHCRRRHPVLGISLLSVLLSSSYFPHLYIVLSFCLTVVLYLPSFFFISMEATG